MMTPWWHFDEHFKLAGTADEAAEGWSGTRADAGGSSTAVTRKS